MKLGLLIIGIHGSSASTFIAGYHLNKNKSLLAMGSYWCALMGKFPLPIYDMRIGGWDYRFNNLGEALKANQILASDADQPELTYYPPILGPSDYAVTVDGHKPSHELLEDAIKDVKQHIKDFREKHLLDKVVVLNISSPKYCNSETEKSWSSNEAYSFGAVGAAADWVEFTPSNSITPELIGLAEKNGSRLVGRDGSTGQTILKIYLRDYFKLRGLDIKSWYSTNLIGNHDGEVLSHADFNRTKFEDKLGVLSPDMLENGSHVVEIQFIQPAGDDKESWDCVHFLGWLNSKMSIRINWHGKDSFLAAPLMLDIVSGLVHAEQKNMSPGLVSDLGLFFKNPLGNEKTSFEQLYKNFYQFVTS